LKKILAYTFFIIVLSSQLKQLAIYTNFKFNQGFIARVLCINQDKPEMKCNGKCHLKKQLKEADDIDQNPVAPKNKKDNVKINLFFFRLFKRPSHFVYNQNKKQLYQYTKTLKDGFISTDFKPPAKLS
jgi:hypothetical protein